MVDLNDESTNALLWTINNILRNGDTLVAIHAIDNGSKADVNDHPAGPFPEDSRRVCSDSVVTGKTGLSSPLAASTLFAPETAQVRSSSSSFTASQRCSDIQQERTWRNMVMRDLSPTCKRLLEATELQVRIRVEVVHCPDRQAFLLETVSIYYVKLLRSQTATNQYCRW